MPDCRNIAAIIHADMCEDDRNGYSWEPRWGGDHPDGYKTFEIDGREYGYWLGSYDCSSSVITAWSQALRYTPFEGILDEAYYTGNMRYVFERSGLFYSEDSANKRGDIYLSDGSHTAMCQDGGNDGVYGYDCMSHFSINENGEVYGGYVGDQTGSEAYVTYFHDHPWNTNLHYNGKADDGGAAPVPTPIIDESEEDMVCLIQPDGQSRLVYYDGTDVHTLHHPDEAEAIRKVYRETHSGKEIPTVVLGSPEAPWANRFMNAVQRIEAPWPSMV